MINLLPWREQKLKAQIKLHWLIGILWGVSLLGVVLALLRGTQNFNSQSYQLQEQIKFQHPKLMELQQHIQQLQPQLKREHQPMYISLEQSISSFEQLMLTPFKGGELQEFAIENGKVSLQGIATNQREFKGIEEFLKKNKNWREVQLQDYNALGEIIFRFTCLINKKL